MLFNSLHFAFFFPLAITIYFATPRQYRWIWLLVSSYYFYMCWNPQYVLLILCSTVVDYFAARWMAKTESDQGRKRLLGLSLGINLGLLGTFKYFNFFSQSVQDALAAFNIFAETPTFQLLLPVGISFYTFQTLSYSIDVYRRKIEPETHFGYFAVYVAFWPQLVAGPIERPSRLLPQLRQPPDLNVARIRAGLSIMLWGFFQKLVIADRLAPFVGTVYDQPIEAIQQTSSAAVWLAGYAFSFQIYCDFSGYSLIAIGAARVMGIHLMINFKRPYFARSVGEFWQRWHISLSTWFKDYVYIPLGGSRVTRMRHFRNLLITFGVSGLWHGAGWAFIVWGLIHGFYLISTTLTDGLRRSVIPRLGIDRKGWLWSNLQRVFTFHLVLFGWVFFRSADLTTAMALISRMFLGPWESAVGIWPQAAGSLSTGSLGAGISDELSFTLALVLIVLLLVQDALFRDGEVHHWLAKLSVVQRRSWYLGVCSLILWFGVFSSQEFIYFQF